VLKIPFDIGLFFTSIVLLFFGIWVMSSVSVYSSYTKSIDKISEEYCNQNAPDNPVCFREEGQKFAVKWCEEQNCNSLYFVRQGQYILIGLIAMIIVFLLPIEIWRTFSVIIFAFAFFLVLLVFTRFGAEFGYARSWLEIPVFGSFQPAELMKLGLLLYLSLWMEKREKDVRGFQTGFLPFIILIFVATLPVMLQPDFGSTFILISIAVSIFFVAGGRILHLIYAGGLVFLLIGIASFFFGYIRERLLTFLDHSKVTEAASHQIQQSYLSIGSGGWFGSSESTQSFGYLPEIQGDMIFSAVAEQLGFFGVLFVLSLFFYFAYRGVKIAQAAPDRFSMLVATGITAWITMQSLVNIFVVSGIFPLTGITLPFFSFGGSSMLMTLFSIGILLKISSLSHSNSSYSGRRHRGASFSSSLRR
jgi:cell division protein FtsW